MNASTLAIALVSALTTFALCRLALWLFPKWGWLDRPHLYGHQRLPVPYSAGMIFLLCLSIVVLAFFQYDKKAIVLLSVAAFITLVSAMDDRMKISVAVRLAVQIIAAVTLFFAGFQVATLTHPWTGGTLLLTGMPVSLSIAGHAFAFSLLSLSITIAWIVLFMNTLNWLDGVPGMVSGISTVAFLTVFGLSFVLAMRSGVGTDEIYNASLVARLALAGAAMTGTFLAFDLPPPRLLMGDAGSMTLGLIIAVLAIYAGSKVATTFLVLGFPIMDALFVIARRVYEGKSPFRGDFRHFHHRLLRIGWTERQTVLALCGICTFFGLAALLANSIGKIAMISLMAVFSAAVEWWVWRKERSNTREASSG